ncbi:Transcriptional regulator, GntR family [Gulosibacter sp. 10]|nr:Transcriptional regulator, GntR family [Gulosibacter sp. 10]
MTRMRQLIIDGTVEPGAPFSEVQLAEEFDVSRTPIREALKQLEREGLVEIRPRVGTFVRKPSLREITELFQLKEVLEGLAASQLAARGEVSELRQLEANVRAEKEAVADGDRQAYAQLVHEFHTTLVVGADNQKLWDQYTLLMNQLAYQRIVAQTLQLPGRLAHSLSEHERVVQAIRTKNPLVAELEMRRHVSASSQSAAVAQFHELVEDADDTDRAHTA